MSGRQFRLIAIVMFIVALAVRLNNALIFPALRGYDSFGHFTYIWYLSETGRVPLATEGWSFFHPPLYHGLMAALWNYLAGVDPEVRLEAGSLIMAVLSLTHAVVGYWVVRRYFPKDHLVQLLAVGLLLFVPVNIYSAPFLGNEGLNAVLCSVSLFALLKMLEHDSRTRACLLGLCLGLAMLVKFSALAIVAASFAAIAMKSWRQAEVRRGMRNLVVVGGIMLAVCGWYYGRNVSVYGTPFKMSREEFMVQHVEHVQTKGERSFLEYVLFDPMIFRRPQWPRGVPLSGPLPATVERSALRESVWTGVYANTWFDGYGGWALPRVTESEWSRRAGQLLLTLGTIPTLLIVLGVCIGMRRLWRKGWDDTLVVTLLYLAAMLAIFVYGTRVTRVHAAIKATYFIPVAVVFAFYLAVATEYCGRTRQKLRRYVGSTCLALAALSVAVFTQGLVLRWDDYDAKSFGQGGRDAFWSNTRGVVDYAGGWKARAATRFTEAADHDLYVGYENLATLALEEQRPLEAIYLLRRAAALQPGQAFGTVPDRIRFTQTAQAEYLTTLSVLYHELGWYSAAEVAARSALLEDGSVPEVNYNVAVLLIGRAAKLEASGRELRAVLLERARRYLGRTLYHDPGFTDALAMLGVSAALAGDCESAMEKILASIEQKPMARRRYPLETNRGLRYDAALRRRRQIVKLPEMLRPEYQLAVCAAYERKPAGML